MHTGSPWTGLAILFLVAVVSVILFLATVGYGALKQLSHLQESPSEVGFRMYSKSNILLLCWAFEANQTSFELITFLLLSSESWDCRCVACCLALVVCLPSDSSFYFCWPLFQSPVSVQSSGNLTEGKEDPQTGRLRDDQYLFLQVSAGSEKRQGPQESRARVRTLEVPEAEDCLKRRRKKWPRVA